MLYTVCKHIKNFFQIGYGVSTYEIVNGKLSLPLLDGQYFMIEGSVLNDGIYEYPATSLKDEKFHGTVYRLAIPQEFLELVKEIETFNEKQADASPYQSESFGGYTYSKATNSRGNIASWQDYFSSRLNAWRKI